MMETCLSAIARRATAGDLRGETDLPALSLSKRPKNSLLSEAKSRLHLSFVIFSFVIPAFGYEAGGSPVQLRR